MKIIAMMNGWVEAPHCWRHFLRRPLRIQRERVLIEQDGHLTVQDAPAVYSVQVLGVVLFLEMSRGMQA